MARMGVFSRQDDTPDNVPRSLQLLSHRNTFDARYMEIYPNYTEILYPNESISLNVTNFVRSIPMKRPQLSRVRVYQKFAAIPIRLLWSAWEDYIKGENDADFLYTEPYIANFTDSGAPTGTDQVGLNKFLGSIAFGAGRLQKISNNNQYYSGEPTFYSGSHNSPWYRGILLDTNGHVPDSLYAGTTQLNELDLSKRRVGYMCGIHELGDYFFHPIAQTTGKIDSYYRPFSAFKFAAYQLCYSFFERSPNVQTRIDDFYEMAQDSNREYPRVISLYDISSNRFLPPSSQDSSFSKSLIGKLVNTLEGPFFQPLVTNLALSDDVEDKLRTTWEYCEKFPLKSGPNMSMLASQPDPVTGLPRYVPSNISLFRKRFANWQTDYFTSCNPWPQRGEESKIPVSGSVTVSLNDLTATFTPTGSVTSVFTGSSSDVISQYASVNRGTPSYERQRIQLFRNDIFPDPNNTDRYALTQSIGEAQQGDSIDIEGVTTPLGSVSSTFTGNEGNISLTGTSSAAVSGLFVSPSNFRFAMTLQHIKEMQAEIDNRYQSYIRKFFGARARDYRLDRPEFLGGSVMELNVADVTQTSQSTDDSLLGDLAGKSVSAQTSRTIRYHADEHTIILGYLYIQPDTEYISGLNRIDSTRDRFDWALPQFSHLSEQAVYNYELSYNGLYEIDQAPETHGRINEAAFGYQPVLNHLRWRGNIACGAFRDRMNQTGTYEEYKPWINVRDYGLSFEGGNIVHNVPSLSDNFLSGRYNRDNSNFDVVDDDLVYPFIVDSYFKVRAVRTISTRGTPSRLG